MHDLELASIINAKKIWRHYLIGEKCNIFIDDKSLKYIFYKTESLDRTYHPITYHLGNVNVVANVLSWKNPKKGNKGIIALLRELRDS